MLSWLSHIDPNTVLALATLVVGWVYHRVRGDSQASLLDSLKSLGAQVVHLLVTDPTITSQTNLDTIKLRARSYLLELAGKAGIPDNSLTDAIVTQIVEQIVAKALAELRSIDATPNLRQIAETATSTLKVLQQFQPLQGGAWEAVMQPDGSFKRVEATPAPSSAPAAASPIAKPAK